MSKPETPKRPKPKVTQPKVTQPRAPKKKPKKGAELSDVSKKATEALGAGVMYDIKIILKLFGKLWVDIDNINNKFETIKHENNTYKLQKKVAAFEKNIKVPKIANADKLRTELVNSKTGNSAIKTLYESLKIEGLKIQMPKLDQIKPPTKEIKLGHLIKQLKDSGVVDYQGKKKILEAAGKRPAKIYKGDFVVLSSTTQNFTGGFIESLNDKDVYIKTSKNSKPIKRKTNELFLIFHLNGNKRRGNEIPLNPGEKPTKKAKTKKKEKPQS